MALNFLNSVNLNQNELIKARIENQPNNTAAGTGVEGQLFYDTTADVLKVWANGAWVEVGGGVTSITTANSTFVSLANSGTPANPIITASLSATNTPDATRYLRGDNAWEPIAAIPGTYTFNINGSTGTAQAVASGDTVTIAGNGYITTVGSSPDTVTISHNSTTRSDTTSTATPAFGGTFTAVDSVTSNATGHITALNLKTVTIPANPLQTITLTGDVTGSGTGSFATTIATGAVEFSMIDPAAVVTASESIVSNNNDTTLPTSAAVKAYVDASVAGGLIYQGGYDAATNTPNLDATPIAGIKKGWTYTVTAEGLFFTEQVRVGDVIIAEIDSPTTLANWTTVQNNIDLASLTQIGIGNVNAGTGVSVAYVNGTATVSSNTPTYAVTITGTATITHGLNTKDIIIQLYDVVTNETVYADVARISTSQATITFASTPTNSIRVLVQKIV